MNQTLVLYHGGCKDGFCAAWVVNKYLNQTILGNNAGAGKSLMKDINVEYHPAYHGQNPPDVKDKNVIMVDFCYDYNIMLEIIIDCKSIIWLDHHKTAKGVANFLGEMINNKQGNYGKVIGYHFSLEKSGAGIAWDFFFSDEPRPWLVDYVEDQDLWLHNLSQSKKINAYVACLEFNFTKWDEASGQDLEDVEMYGSIALKKTEQYVREVCKNMYMRSIASPASTLDTPDRVLGWHEIPIVNIPQIDCSEVVSELCSMYPDSPFALYWFKRADGLYQYGLRSRNDFDVSAVAKLFGGGGHKNAAGFQLPYLLEELK